MTSILYLTDLYYKAQGRNYYEEDLFITSRLKQHFNILIGHPHQAISQLDRSDIIVFRNTGAVLAYQEYFEKFLSEVKKKNLKTFNSFDGKADILGKQYLPDLMKLGFAVIPTIEDIKDLDLLANPSQYVVKLKNGADSIGMDILAKEELLHINPKEKLIQPFIDFEYEVSFYYLNNSFQYALYAPDKKKRWSLREYLPTEEDLKFANKFIQWNDMERGIIRVDACRLKNHSLLLVELEDLNPYLSLDLLSKEKQDLFIDNFIIALKQIN